MLVATLPSKVGDRKPHQQRIPTGHKANAQGLKLAHRQALLLSSTKLAGTFSWDDWTTDAPAPVSPGATPGEITVAAAVKRFEDDFWQGRVRTGAAERTWKRNHADLKKLPAGATLTIDLLVAVAEGLKPGSRSRQEFIRVAKRLALLVDLDGVDRLVAVNTPYQPKERELPSPEEIAAVLLMLKGTRWEWATWAVANYGCRPAEVFSLQPLENGTAKVLTVKRAMKLPTWRTALALPVGDPVERQIEWDVRSPADYDSLEAHRMVNNWGRSFVRATGGMQLYDLRHAWAVRSIHKGLNASLAAKCLGHSLSVHSDTYHRYMDAADVAAVAASLQ